MGRPSNTLERRREIVDGLLTVMAKRGYDGASIQAIAQTAGLAPGLIHYHFENKQEILLEAVRELRTLLDDRFHSLAQKAATPRDRLRAFLDARLARGEGANAAAVAAWVVIGAEAVRQPEVKAAYQDAMAGQQRQLELLIREYAGDALSPRETHHLTGAVLATIEGMFQLSVSAEAIMPRNYAAETVMALVESYVQRRATERRPDDGRLRPRQQGRRARRRRGPRRP